MKPEIKIFATSDELADELASEFQMSVTSAAQSGDYLYIALSGGSTPAMFFEHLAAPIHRSKIPWQNVHIFWGDERCVPPDHPDSNFGMARRSLFNYISIPGNNVHRIRGEKDPHREVDRYSAEIKNIVPNNASRWPQFDWIFLGLGEDGHTASIFPGANVLQENEHICAVATHPHSGQKRITLTLPVINNAKRISFLVTGKTKASVVAAILQENKKGQSLPAGRVHANQGILEWYVDRAATDMLK